MPFITEKPAACSLHEVKKMTNLINKYPDIYSRFIHNYSAFLLEKWLGEQRKVLLGILKILE